MKSDSRATLFLLKAALLIGGTAAAVLGLSPLTRYILADKAFTAALVDKHHFAQSIKSPKVLLVGGSNLIFSVNSQLLAQRLHQPVVNLALLAPLGVKFILADAVREVKPGDMVIVSCEYLLTESGDVPSQLAVTDYLEDCDNLVEFPNNALAKWKLKASYILEAPSRLLTAFQHPRVKDSVSIYFRNAFSKEGDLLSHVNNFVPGVKNHDLDLSVMNTGRSIAEINAFTGKCHRLGARVFFLFPTVSNSLYRDNQREISELSRELKSSLKAVLLNEPEDVVYADSLFFDSPFHIQASVRDGNTEKIAGQIVSKSAASHQLTQY